MTIRTFKQFGQAYGSSPVQIIAKIDGTEVFNGTVTALDQPVPIMPLETTIESQVLFTWTADLAFEGTKAVEITAIGGTIILTEASVNYGTAGMEQKPDLAYQTPISTGPDVFQQLIYSEILVDKTGARPRTGIVNPNYLYDVAINGIPLIQDTSSGLAGQWTWVIYNGKVLTGSINVIEGVAVA
jgi:hypothetical protein